MDKTWKRLIEMYFLVGLEEPVEKSCIIKPINKIEFLKNKFAPKILDTLPKEEIDPAFANGVLNFCMPHSLKLSHSTSVPSFFMFVTTRDDGKQLYGYCLTIYEKATEELVTKLCQLTYGIDFSIEEITTRFQINLSDLYIPKCLCLISKYVFPTKFKDYLLLLYSLSLSDLDYPIERYLSNFIFEFPSPPKGTCSYQYILSHYTLEFIRSPNKEPFLFTDLPFYEVIEALGTEIIIKLFIGLLLEKQTIIVSTNSYLLSTTCEILRSILFPFKWLHVYIPIIPEIMYGVLEAPIPFLLGLPVDKPNVKVPIGESTVCYNIDTGKLIYPTDINILPQPAAVTLNQLVNDVKMYDEIYKERGDNYYDDIFPMLGKTNEREKKYYSWQIFRNAFLNFIARLMKPYEMCICKEETSLNIRNHFNNEIFINNSIPHQKEFISHFLETQFLLSFIDTYIKTNGTHYTVTILNDRIKQQDQKSSSSSYYSLSSSSFWTTTKNTFRMITNSGFVNKVIVIPSIDISDLPKCPFRNHKWKYSHFPIMNQEYILPPRYHLLPVETRVRKNSLLENKAKYASIVNYSYEQCIYTLWFIVACSSENLKKSLNIDNFDKITAGNKYLNEIFPKRNKSNNSNNSFSSLSSISSSSISSYNNNNNNNSCDNNNNNSIIDSINNIPSLEMCYLVLRSMKTRNIIPTEIIFRTLIISAGKMKNVQFALLIIELMGDYGYTPDSSLYNHIIKAFSNDESFSLEVFTQRIKASEAKKKKNENLLESWISFRLKSSTTSETSYFNIWSKHLLTQYQIISLNKIFPGLKINKSLDSCPYCNMLIQDDEIKQGWYVSINDYTTQCNKCYNNIQIKGIKPPDKPVRFVPRIRIAADFSMLYNSETDELWTEYLSPWILLKEIQRSIDFNRDVDFTKNQFITTRPALFWNMLAYFIENSLPICHLLPSAPLEELPSPPPSLPLSTSLPFIQDIITSNNNSSIVIYNGSNKDNFHDRENEPIRLVENEGFIDITNVPIDIGNSKDSYENEKFTLKERDRSYDDLESL